MLWFGILMLVLSLIDFFFAFVGIVVGENLKGICFDLFLGIICLMCGCGEINDYIHRNDFKEIKSVKEYMIDENLNVCGSDTTKTYTIYYLK